MGAEAAEWISAIGQGLGAIATAVAVIVALRIANRESRWRREDQADRDAAQARTVTVEPTYDPMTHPDTRMILRVLNGSRAPVFDVKVTEFVNVDRPDLRWKIDDRNEPIMIKAPVLAAGDVFVLPVSFIEANDQRVLPDGEDFAIIEFTDAAGLQWRRRNNDAPVRVLAR